MLITIKDETFAGKILHELQLEFAQERVTIQDVITSRVHAEVDNYYRQQLKYFRGLVEPTDAEQTLNGVKVKTNKPIDAEKQVYVALDAFQRNVFFVLVDNVQAESLAQEVILTNTTSVSFIKLTPLVGG